MDLDQLMAASTTTNFNPSAGAAAADGASTSAAAAPKVGAGTKKKGVGTAGLVATGGAANVDEILRHMNDPNILDNDPLSDERNAAYASAYLAKVTLAICAVLLMMLLLLLLLLSLLLLDMESVAQEK